MVTEMLETCWTTTDFTEYSDGIFWKWQYLPSIKDATTMSGRLGTIVDVPNISDKLTPKYTSNACAPWTKTPVSPFKDYQHRTAPSGVEVPNLPDTSTGFLRMVPSYKTMCLATMLVLKSYSDSPRMNFD